jgi:hypothetical protein
MPDVGEFNLCEGSEAVSDDVLQFVTRFLPSINATRELPPSIGHIHRLPSLHRDIRHTLGKEPATVTHFAEWP